MSASIGGDGNLAPQTNGRPSWQPVPLTIRPPSSNSAPVVVSATNMGTGGGANVGANSDMWAGTVHCFSGIGAAFPQVVTLQFPATPASPILVTCDWAQVVTVTQGPPVVVTLNRGKGNAPGLADYQPSTTKPHNLAYRQTVLD